MSRFIADWLGRPAPAPLGTGITSVQGTAPLRLTLAGSSILGSVDNMTGCSGMAAGLPGAVPTPAAGDQKKALLGDGTWGTPDGSLTSVTEAVAGDMSVTVTVTSGKDTTLKVSGAADGDARIRALGGYQAGIEGEVEIAGGELAQLKLSRNDAAIIRRRWVIGKTGSALEVGLNSGSDLVVSGYDDGENLIGDFLTLVRASGRARFSGDVETQTGFIFPDASVQTTKFDQDDNARVTVEKAGVTIGARRAINLVEGPNVTITAVDNPGSERVDVTVTSLGAGGGSTLADGDYGDVTASAGGTVLTIDNDAVTYAKMQNTSASDVLLGRSSTGGGNVEEIPCTAAGRALLDDANAAAQRTTLGAISQDGNARVAVKKAGSVIGTRRGINLIEGAGVTLTVTDDSGNEEVDVEIAATGGGGGATLRAQTYETGSGNWVAPAGLLNSEAWVTGCGGGGGGGGKTYPGSSYNGGGGGGAASCFRRKVTVVAGDTYAYAIGAGGAAGTSASADGSTTAGSAGGSTTLGAVLTLAGGAGGGRGLIGSFATAGAGGAAGGPGGTPGTHGPTTNGGLATPGGVSFPPGWGAGGEGSSLTSSTAGSGAATAGRGGYLLIEWNE